MQQTRPLASPRPPSCPHPIPLRTSAPSPGPRPPRPRRAPAVEEFKSAPAVSSFGSSAPAAPARRAIQASAPAAAAAADADQSKTFAGLVLAAVVGTAGFLVTTDPQKRRESQMQETAGDELAAVKSYFEGEGFNRCVGRPRPLTPPRGGQHPAPADPAPPTPGTPPPGRRPSPRPAAPQVGQDLRRD